MGLEDLSFNVFNPLMHSTFFSNFLFKFTGDMPFRAQMTNIYSFFSYLKIYLPFFGKKLHVPFGTRMPQ
jgi:hypothetical protein